MINHLNDQRNYIGIAVVVGNVVVDVVLVLVVVVVVVVADAVPLRIMM